MNRIKNDTDDYHGNTKYKCINDIRYLFNGDKDEYGYEDIRYLFNEDKITHKDTYCAEKIKKNKIQTSYKKSPFKSIIEDIKRGLYYVEKKNYLSIYQHQILKA